MRRWTARRGTAATPTASSCGRATPNRFLVAEAAALPAGRALDVACGEGRNAVWLAERGWRVTGVDFSEVGLEKARALARARGVRAEWVAADLLGYTPEPQAFELVLVFYLQVPAAERRPIVRAAAGAVAPGGRFLLVGHDRRNLEHGHGGPQDPAVLYTAGDVVGDLEGAGLEIERAETVNRPVDDARGGTRRARRARPRPPCWDRGLAPGRSRVITDVREPARLQHPRSDATRPRQPKAQQCPVSAAGRLAAGGRSGRR